MKARVKTPRQKYLELEKREIARINKIWMTALNQVYGFGEKRLLEVYADVCERSGEIFNNPEQWYYIDELLLDKFHMADLFEREDIGEREQTAKEIHKENGKKWRQY